MEQEGLTAAAAHIAASELVDLCQKQNLTISTAESLTGGAIGGAIVSIAGASNTFCGGIIAYQDSIKERLLGVRRSCLKEFGAVSRECVAQMAIGACKKFDSDVAISVSGYAGPSGGKELSAGCVWIGILYRGKSRQFLQNFEGDREFVIAQTVIFALRMATEAILYP